MASLTQSEFDIMRSLGWSAYEIEEMTDVLAQDVIADYYAGIRRTGSGADPNQVFIDTFTSGVESDIIGTAQTFRDTFQNLGGALTQGTAAIKEAAKNSPLIVIGLVVFLIYTWGKK